MGSRCQLSIGCAWESYLLSTGKQGDNGAFLVAHVFIKCPVNCVTLVASATACLSLPSFSLLHTAALLEACRHPEIEQHTAYRKVRVRASRVSQPSSQNHLKAKAPARCPRLLPTTLCRKYYYFDLCAHANVTQLFACVCPSSCVSPAHAVPLTSVLWSLLFETICNRSGQSHRWAPGWEGVVVELLVTCRLPI